MRRKADEMGRMRARNITLWHQRMAGVLEVLEPCLAAGFIECQCVGDLPLAPDLLGELLDTVQRGRTNTGDNHAF
ncbi:hypothetical protein VPH13_14025 [Stenotrophomonas pavanii]|uniref:hypothetical protein n=1 Tax=Stenotrophomonas pavanii TaxID=487698 RepID=UPI002DBD5F46|nr:hypothetical protein [Stenotrophomonas pavanii]MEC4339839.1 hypothetical protein [Stenotrophomonas pavanii]